MDAYGAVVFGGAVFDGSWTPEAEAFIRRNRDALARRPVWLFSVGSFSDRKRVIGRLMRREPKHIDEIRRAIGPRDYRVFAGIIRREQWPFLSRAFYHALGGRLGDNRDWNDIENWARDIAHALAARTGD